MANPAVEKGFQPTGVMYGTMPFSKDADQAVAVYRGDVMSMDDDGNAITATAGLTQLIGSAMGTVSSNSYAQKALLPASTAGTVLATWHVSQEYTVLMSAATTPTQTMIGNNFDHVATAGNSTTGNSKHRLNGADASGSAAAGFRLLDYVLAPELDESAVSPICRVEINEHFLKTTTGI